MSLMRVEPVSSICRLLSNRFTVTNEQIDGWSGKIYSTCSSVMSGCVKTGTQSCLTDLWPYRRKSRKITRIEQLIKKTLHFMWATKVGCHVVWFREYFVAGGGCLCDSGAESEGIKSPSPPRMQNSRACQLRLHPQSAARKITRERDPWIRRMADNHKLIGDVWTLMSRP